MNDLVKFIKDICNGRSDDESLLLSKLNLIKGALASDVTLDYFEDMLTENSSPIDRTILYIGKNKTSREDTDIGSVFDNLSGIKVARDGVELTVSESSIGAIEGLTITEGEPAEADNGTFLRMLGKGKS